MANEKKQRRVGLSILALLIGLITNIVLSTGTDAVLQATRIYPPLSEPQRFTTGLLILATTYRTIYGIFGSYLVAKFAPDHPMGHALFLGVLGFIVSLIGVIVMWNFGQNWYPIALVLLSIPCAWAGARIYLMSAVAEA